MQAPKYQVPPPDPTLTSLKAQASVDEGAALRDTAAMDTATMMARYGTRLAMAGATTGSPLAVTPPPVAGRV